MASKILPLVFIITFVFGWFCSSAYSSVISQVSVLNSGDAESASPDDSFIGQYLSSNKERYSPSDWISEGQIHVYNDRVVIDLNSPQWAVFTDTNSMDPVIDQGAHAIEVAPESEKDINVGDIISYQSEFVEGTVIHRVIETGTDADGWYARAKGDNNPFEDPGRIRFSQIKRVLVAIIY